MVFRLRRRMKGNSRVGSKDGFVVDSISWTIYGPVRIDVSLHLLRCSAHQVAVRRADREVIAGTRHYKEVVGMVFGDGRLCHAAAIRGCVCYRIVVYVDRRLGIRNGNSALAI